MKKNLYSDKGFYRTFASISKLKTPLQKYLLLLFFTLTSVGVFGQYSGTGTFTKITSLTDLTDGYYVVAYGNTFAMTNTNAGSYFTNTAISPTGNVITNPAKSIVWNIATNGTGRSIYNEVSATYVSFTGSANAAQAVTTSPTINERWTFTYNSSLFNIANVAIPARLLQYNTGAPRFACYTGSQQNITLYKLDTPAYSLAYDGNTSTGGTAPVDASSPYASGSTVTVLGAGTLVKSGSTFSGWNTASNGTGTSRAVASTFSMPASAVTLFAQWTLNATAPTVTTTTATSIATTSATSGGNVTSDGGASVTARGVYYATTATPTSGTTDGTGTGFFSSSLTPLTVNTKYFYRAYATNSAGTAYGTEYNFYTLANVPLPPTVNTPTTTTLNVTVNANGNPAVTTFAINETSTGKFVQADGTLGAAAVWQTAATWGTKTVTGLTPSTTYTFQVKARNGDTTPVETAYSATTGGTTSADAVISFQNIQFPASATIAEGGNVDVYAQAYKAGYTEAAGAATGLSAWIGYSSNNTNPNTASWTWVPATYNGQGGPGNNNDEWKGNIGTGLTPGTYYYASRFQINTGSYTYGGKNGNWNNDSGVLTVNSNVAQSGQVYPPSGGPITVGSPYVAYVKFYKAGFTDQGGQGTPVPTVEIGYNSNNNNAVTGAGWTWDTASFDFNGSNNDQYKLDIGTARATGTYYYAARVKIQGSTEYKYFGTSSFAYWNNDNGTFTVNPNVVDGGSISLNPTSVKEGNTSTASIQIYEPGETNPAGQAPGIVVQVAYSLTNGNPSTFTGWTNATYNGDIGNNDNYTYSLPNNLTPGTYYVAARAIKNGSTVYQYFGTSFNTWSNNSAVLTVTSNLADFANIQLPKHDQILSQGTGVDVYAQVRIAGVTDILPDNPGGGVTAWIGYSSTKPTTNASFTTGWTWVPAPYNPGYVSSGTYNANNDEYYVPNFGQTAGNTFTSNVGTYYFVSRFQKTGSTEYVYGGSDDTDNNVSGGIWNGTTFTERKITVQSAQEINIKQGATDIATNGTYAFANQISGTSSAAVSFTVQNTGQSPLTVGLLSKSGTNAGEFAITQVASSPVAGGSSTTFTVTFSPTSLGAKTAQLSLVSNDGDENPYIINLTGTGTDINTITYAQGNYLSITGAGSYTVVSSWGRCNQIGGCTGTTLGSGGWGAAGANSTPIATTTAFIQGNITGGTTGIANMTIFSGGTLITSGNYPISNSMTVKTGGVLNIGSNLNFSDTAATFTVEDDATVKINNSYGTPSSSIWNGVENFHPNSNLYIQNWDFANDFLIPDNTSISSNSYNGYEACFGNIIIDAGTNTKSWIMLASNTNVNLAHGDLKFISNGANITVGSTGTVLSGIGGNFIVDDLYTGTNVIQFKTSGTFNFTINGNMQLDAATTRVFTASGISSVSTLNVNGNINITPSAVLDFNSTISANPLSIINLKGNLTGAGSGLLQSSNSSNLGNFNFVGTGDGLTSATTQTIDIASTSTSENKNINFNVKSGAYVKLINRDFELGTNSKLTVESGGTFDFGFLGSTALNVTRSGSQTSQQFESKDGSTLKVTSSLGLTSFGDYTGNVQIGASALNRVYGPSATYRYMGKSATEQVTGNGIATSTSPLTGKIIVDMETAAGQFSAFDSRTINGTGTLEIIKGIVKDDTTHGFIGSGNLLMQTSTGRYITSRTSLPQPELQGNYTLTNGVIEFATNLPSEGRIRVTPEYYNVDISGSNITIGGKELTVKNVLNVKSTGKITVAATSDSADPNVVIASKGIQVDYDNGGRALFNNNAHLMQDDTGVSNSGKITMERIAKLPAAGYNYWGSPVSGQQTKGPGGFSPDTLPSRFYSYRESNDRFYETGDANFVAGKGYAVKGTATTGAGYPFNFIGTPNNGNVSIGVTKSADTPTADPAKPDVHGYNLLGNPYPSTLSFDDFFQNNKNEMYCTALFWTNNDLTITQQQGSGYGGVNYAIYNGSGGTPAPYLGALTTTTTPTGLIKPGQGFIIQLNGIPRSTSLVFTNGMRGTGATVFFNNAGKSTATVKDRFHLALTTPANINSVILVAYVNGATDNYEQDFDAELVAVGSDSFYSKLEGKKLAIQGRNYPLVDSDVVPLGEVFFQDGLHKISIQDSEGIFAGAQSIYLKDKLLNKTVDLSKEAYTFTATKGTDDSRFEIVYKPQNILTTGDIKESKLVVYKDSGSFVVRDNTEKITKVELFDSSGKLVKVKNSNSLEVRVDAVSLPSGVYVLKIHQNEKIIVKKVQN